MAPRRVLPFLLIGLLVIAARGGGVAAREADPAGLHAPGALPGTGFTYQGQLESGGAPVSGVCDLQAGLWEAASGGVQVGVTQTVPNVPVTGGLFTTVFNAGNEFTSHAFDGSARWLGLAVRCPAGGGSYTTLTPRQGLTAAPLALALPGMRTEINGTSPNVAGGYTGNLIQVGVVGGTIGGGGESAFPHVVSGDYATVSGGNGNTASGEAAAVGGGCCNLASGAGATVGGGGWDGVTGDGNLAQAAASTVGGGWSNMVAVTGTYGTIAGGRNNLASGYAAAVGGGNVNAATATAATVAGGENNKVTGNYGTVGGGLNNTAGNFATVAGGSGNTASGLAAMVPGGALNLAFSSYSFAAGLRASALHSGAFVWADSTGAPISSTVADQFLVRASGGVSLTTSAAGTVGASLAAGSGTWDSFSDRNAKANFAPVDGRHILDLVMGLPIETWNYNTQDASIRHMGPMAQDFYAAFGLGVGETTIGVVDADGVALAAIQGLYSVVQAKESEIAALTERVAALEAGETAHRAVSTSAALPWLLLAGLGLLNVGGLAGYALARRRGR